jgi:hypothetical protein
MFLTMDRQKPDEEDLLRKFINPGKIYKAPEGFTSKTMARIRIESQTSGLKNGFFVKNRVPLISAAVTAGFIIIAILIPANDNITVGSAVWQYLQNIEITLPEIGNTYLQDFSLPGWVPYALMAFLLLGFIDRALSGFFHKENNR